MDISQKNAGDGIPPERTLTKAIDQVGETPIIDNVFGSYHIENGRLAWNKITHDGDINIPLAGFTARISKEILLDNGINSQRQYEIQGILADGTPLPTIRIPSSTFTGMNWVSDRWGTKAVMAAGSSLKDRLREAIQLYSNRRGIEEQRVFNHTGWRAINGKIVFLDAGCLEAEVELSAGLHLYRLPHACEDPRTACRASRYFLKLAPLSITVPLLSVQYLAPLSEFLHPAFTLWLCGQSGTFKTTTATLALCHYGNFDVRNLPASWESTDNTLERLAFEAQDLPLLIDDYYPQATLKDQKLLEQKVGRIVRAQGNLVGRGRMKADTSLREPYPPRGIIISTGEQLPSIGVSGIARLFRIEVNPGDINIPTLNRCQQLAPLYTEAMRAYLDYLVPQIPYLKEKLPREFLEIRTKAAVGKEHYKVPEAVAWLFIGFELAVNFWMSVGAVSGDEANELLNKGWETLNRLGEAQAGTIHEEDPCIRFLETIAILLAQKRVYFAERKTGAAPENAESWGWTSFENSVGDKKFKIRGQSELLGWIEDSTIFLIPEVAYKVVTKFGREQAEPFIISKTEILRRLERGKILIPFENGERTKSIYCGGLNHRVAQIVISAIDKS
jgi:hypothetical protein